MTAGQTEAEVVITNQPNVDGKMYFNSPDGLRSIVLYRECDDGLRIYASGDTTYGLIAFWLYRSLRDGDPPNIVEFGKPSDA